MVKFIDLEEISAKGCDENANRCTMEGTLQATAGRGHAIHTVIDIGASNGSWSRSCMKYYPMSSYLLVEAQPVHENALTSFCSMNQNAQFILAAAGDTAGEINFHAADPFGGVASYTPFATDNIKVPVTMIDMEVLSRKLPGPYLLKLDTHGYEVPILKGAAAILQETEVIVIECYNFRIATESLLFYEMCDYLERLGFRCIDIVDPLYRPGDDALWQMDMVFVRSDRPEFGKNTYL
jgi:FkbM family methyltransferase